MSAVSKKLMPASSAASTTSVVARSSIRQPKLLQPTPTTVTSSVPMRRLSIVCAFPTRCYPEYLNPLVFPRTALLCLAIFVAAAQEPPPFAPKPVLLDTMKQELDRNFTALKQKADPPPYFMSYEVTETDYQSISASLGAITSSNGGKNRALDVSVRVGSPKLDNYRRIRGDRGQFTAGSVLTYEDNPNAIKQRLWLETDRAYR